MASVGLMLAVVGLSMSGRDVQASSLDGCPDVIVEKFGDRAETACYVAYRESRFNPWATGSLGEKGYFQLHPVHGSRSTYDPEGNTEYAYELSEGGTNWCRHWRWVCL